MYMNDKQDRLEAVMHRKLRALPEIQAPAGLAAEVMRRLAAPEARPWWRCPWMDWPGLAQIISAAGMSVVVGGACYWRDSLVAVGRSWSGRIPGISAFGHETWMIGQTLANVLGDFLAAARFPWLAAAAVVVASAYLGVIGVGAVFWQVMARERGSAK